MTAQFQSPQPPRPSFLTSLIMLEERIRRDRIITLPVGEYHEMPAAHVAAAAMKKDRM